MGGCSGLGVKTEVGVVRSPVHLDVLSGKQVDRKVPIHRVYGVTFDCLLLPAIGLVSSIFVDPCGDC